MIGLPTPLEACPFCASESVSVEFPEAFRSRKTYRACCLECEAEGPGAETEAGARLAWNNRV